MTMASFDAHRCTDPDCAEPHHEHTQPFHHAHAYSNDSDHRARESTGSISSPSDSRWNLQHSHGESQISHGLAAKDHQSLRSVAPVTSMNIAPVTSINITQTQPAPPKKHGSFYRRPLPTPPSEPFTAPAGRKLFSEALSEGTLECFFPLIEQFRTQDHPAFCGLASLAMVLNALQVDPGRTWKGAWRWFDEGKLDCCKPLDR